MFYITQNNNILYTIFRRHITADYGFVLYQSHYHLPPPSSSPPRLALLQPEFSPLLPISVCTRLWYWLRNHKETQGNKNLLYLSSARPNPSRLKSLPRLSLILWAFWAQNSPAVVWWSPSQPHLNLSWNRILTRTSVEQCQCLPR